MRKFAERMNRIRPSATLKMMQTVQDLKKKGINVISFNVGEPDFTTPAHIIDAAKAALDKGMTHYTPARGLPDLREAIAKKMNKENNIKCTANDVIVTTTKFGIFASVLACCDKGDEVLMPDPTWVSYMEMATFANADVKFVSTVHGDDLSLTAEDVANSITPRTKLIMLNSPSNPTGAIIREKDLKGIADLAIDHDLFVLSDEIYEYIIFNGKHVSIGSFPGMAERTITVNGFSKAFAMTGWRLGWIVAPEKILGQVGKLQEHAITCATSFAQVAGITALEGSKEPVNKMVSEFKKRRDLICGLLNEIPGIHCAVPDGTFYAFPRYDMKMSSQELGDYLLNEAHVAVTAGSAFGPHGEGFIRMSFATSPDNIKKGVEQMRTAVEELRKKKG